MFSCYLSYWRPLWQNTDLCLGHEFLLFFTCCVFTSLSRSLLGKAEDCYAWACPVWFRVNEPDPSSLVFYLPAWGFFIPGTCLLACHLTSLDVRLYITCTAWCSAMSSSLRKRVIFVLIIEVSRMKEMGENDFLYQHHDFLSLRSPRSLSGCFWSCGYHFSSVWPDAQECEAGALPPTPIIDRGTHQKRPTLLAAWRSLG